MDLQTLLQGAAGSDFTKYNPARVIDAVNALQPLGKDQALAAIDAYLAKVDLDNEPQQGLFLVLRVLFEVPASPGYHPPMLIGGGVPPPPADPRALPRYPVALVDDVPLMMISGYELGGDAQPVTAHVEHFRKQGTVRAAPLQPSRAAADVLAKYEALHASVYGTAPTPRHLGEIKAQLDRYAADLP